jgi:DNA repair exonuclease SbcCD ATPase subunit
MNQILKRLELIKTAIELDDEEIVELQVVKLKKLNIDEEIKQVLVKLESLDYGLAMVNIENYLKRYSGLSEYVDSELQGLKLELKSLENNLEELASKKNEYLNDIEEFNTLYNLKLGSIIKEILKLKEEILAQSIKDKQEKAKKDKKTFNETKENIKEIEDTLEQLKDMLENIDEDSEEYDEIFDAHKELDDELKKLQKELKKAKKKKDTTLDEEYEEVKNDYEEFSDEYEEIKQKAKEIIELDEDDKKKIKTLYRKASRLCHPDIVVDEIKEKAHEIMQALNAAYSIKDIKAVKKILKNLENGIAFEVASEKINDKKLLKAKIEELREKIEQVNEEIENIKEDDSFEIISTLEDWSEYFESVKEALEEEKESLEQEASKKELHVEKPPIQTPPSVKQENSKHSRDLKNIEQPTFEKIRRYYSNIEDADELHVEFAKDGKKYKAFIYSALDEFLESLEGKSINIVDWNCKQGIASTLAFDYIREKQLDIKVTNVLLIEEDEKALSRTMLHVDVIKNEALHVNGICKPLEDVDFSELSFGNKNLTLFLGLKSDNEVYCEILNKNFENPICYVFIDEEYDENVSKIYEYLEENFKVKLISKKDGKIGRYERYENIFKIKNES